MSTRLGHPPTIPELAAEVHLSPYHFLRVFKKDLGRTPHRYLTDLRIDEAKRLLEQGTTVTRVAARCGYRSTAHFSAAFLRETGLRPSRWRRGCVSAG